MFKDRQEAIRAFIRSTGDQAFLLTAPEDVRWACGFSGSNGVLLISDHEAALFTDGRYTEQAQQETGGIDIHILAGNLFVGVGEHVGASMLSSIGIDASNTSVIALQQLEARPDKPQIHCYETPFASLVAAKSEGELRRLRRAQEITDDVYAEVLTIIRPGMSEQQVAADIVCGHLKRGAEKMSFDPIVASGDNAALPHAKPTDRQLAVGDMIILDFGCFFEGYASDMTRTVALGTPSSDAVRLHALVREAQAAAQRAARSGMRACDLDRVARNVIEEAGLGDAFTHSLGHGIGLRIHETPRIAASNDAPLPDGAVVTIEPGVYIPGRFGVRIENAVVLHPDGCEALTKSSTELAIL